MSPETSSPPDLYQPRKRIFIAVLSVACLLLLGITFLLWYVPNVGLRQIHPLLPPVFSVLLGLFALVILAGMGVLVLTLLTGRDLFLTQRLRGLVIRYLFPAIVNFGRLLGVDRDLLQQSFIALNNQLVRARKLQITPDRALILLPHCIQLFDCAIKITGDVSKCSRCGMCDISGLTQLAERFGIEVAVATGGTLARRLIVEKRPRFILAVACERDLTSGIRDAYPLPVIGVLNHRPNGPCFNTGVVFAEMEGVLREHIVAS
ncbi:MAG: hypothetical protein C0624_10950 [Desulfuromonas sp.]|nr:MAG: hypothetical protein C0624_10950 [Desulfuromonas sp.]